jgi:putative transport protein
MSAMSLLREQPLFLLFTIGALGSLLGSVRIWGFSLGVAGVLFVGLTVSAFDATLVLPDFVPQLGLVLFVYGIGVSGGPAFFASLGKGALKTALVALSGLLVSAVTIVVGARLLGLSSATMAGLFAGSLTNTPALAGVVEALRGTTDAALQSAPVVAYSVAYPMGVLAVLLIMHLLRGGEAGRSIPAPAPSAVALVSRTVRVTQPAAIGRPADGLRKHEGWSVVLGRHKRGELVSVVSELTVLEHGDLITVVGSLLELERAIAFLGEPSDAAIERDHSSLDFRRVFVSRPEVVGRPIREVQDQLEREFDAQVTRIRRGDVDVLPSDELRLEPGDRVRVLAPRESIDKVSRFFGDSYRAISEVDVVTVGVGIGLGLMLGNVQLSPLPGLKLSLGAAGGPLVVGLVLGRLVRTGPFTWSMPYSANLTLRQFGLLLFFAGVGTRSGSAFAGTAFTLTGLELFGLGLVSTVLCAATVMLLGRALLGPWTPRLWGVVAGTHTQPAALAFAVERSGNEAPNSAYAQVLPLATIAKILIAQVVLALFG